MLMDGIIAELKAQRDRLDQAINALEGLPAAPAPVDPAPVTRPTMSAARRRAISKAMKARWAASRRK